MSIAIFWIQKSDSEFFQGMSEPHVKMFTELQMSEALLFCNKKRKEPGVTHVTMSSQNPNSIGNPGVDSVEDGVLPGGGAYDWKKRRV